MNLRRCQEVRHDMAKGISAWPTLPALKKLSANMTVGVQWTMYSIFSHHVQPTSLTTQRPYIISTSRSANVMPPVSASPCIAALLYTLSKAGTTTWKWVCGKTITSASHASAHSLTSSEGWLVSMPSIHKRTHSITAVASITRGKDSQCARRCQSGKGSTSARAPAVSGDVASEGSQLSPPIMVVSLPPHAEVPGELTVEQLHWGVGVAAAAGWMAARTDSGHWRARRDSSWLWGCSLAKERAE
mmetsp:Transcript_36443/g.93142  ORF Transcript_36443/g.93142 Transcript_36443/m.93142 type:complete len:244 (-) Transcript_36443:908-1639(-)